MENKNESIIRTILKNEITWVVFIGGFVVTFFTQIIIPINTIQIQLATLQTTITSIQSYDARITQNSNDILVIKQQIKQLSKEQP